MDLYLFFVENSEMKQVMVLPSEMINIFSALCVTSLSNNCVVLHSTTIGYSSPQLSDIPISPPPSYEAVMKEVKAEKRREGKKINYELMENCFSRLRLHALPQNQLLALDKENNAIQTTIHTNLLVESFYTTSHASNNNLLNEMNEFTINNSQSLTSPARDNLLIDGSECTDECNQSTCNCMSSDGGCNNNDEYGRIGVGFPLKNSSNSNNELVCR